ncbi:MAG: hypothetical protein MJ025_01050 [Victivallaceae bacterium]|nr:hypothetical protein [Victivallaceae bacterium]
MKKLAMLVSCVGIATAMTAGDAVFKEEFNVFRGKSPANWITLQTSSDSAAAFVRADKAFRMISPSNMFMPITDPISDGRVDLTIGTVGFNPACRYGFNVHFRQDPEKRTSQTIRFFNVPDSGKLQIMYGTTADNFFIQKEKKTVDVPKDVFSKKVDVSVEFSGDKVKAVFDGKAVDFSGVGGEVGQISIGRLNFFDSLELTKFEISGIEKTTTTEHRKFRVDLPGEPFIDKISCDVDFSEHGSFYEAVLTLSGGSYLSEPGQGYYHGMRTERIDHPYFKLITADGITEYNLLDGFMHLANKKIAPKHVYTVIYDPPEWPFRRVIRFAKPLGDFDMAIGAKFAAYRPNIDLAMEDCETVFDSNGKVLFAGRAPEKVASATLLSSPDKAIVSKLPKSPKYNQAVQFAKLNHFFYRGEPLDFTLELSGMSLPGNAEIALTDAFLHPMKRLELKPTESLRKIGVRDMPVKSFRFHLDPLPIGVYHITVKSLDETIPLDRFFAFEVMPDDPTGKTAAQVSGLPYMYCAETETRGLTTDAFDPFKPYPRNFPHYVSGTVFLPWYAREADIFDTLHLFGRRYFAWLGNRCLDKWHLDENMDIVKKADFAHFGVEMQFGTAVQLYRGRLLKIFIEFAKQTKDPFYDIARLEKLAAGKFVASGRDGVEGLENVSIDPETYRHTVVNHWPEWLDFVNRRTADDLHAKLVELRKVNPNIKFACYGPAPIYTGRYVGPEFARYLTLSMLDKDDVGYLQYEDYPELCNYPESRGSFFLGTLSMCVPQIPIAPEMYGDGFGSGCPDGAVFFAHPPYGMGGNNYFFRTRNRVYEYTYATAFLGDEGFAYWNRFGIQIGSARYERLENFLKAWGNTMRNRPIRPMKSAAYVFSSDSWRANQGGDAHFKAKAVEGTDVPMVFDAARVRKTAGEMMPFFYETVSNNGLCAGFQLMANNLKQLSAADCDILVLPPLKGVPEDQLKEIRRLYDEGVSLVCSEDPGALSDIFQVKDGGKFVKVTEVRGTDGFLRGMKDYTTDVCFGGRFVAAGAEKLLDGEIPVLFRAKGKRANAYFFNVPPTTATSDMLWERYGYGRQVISKLMISAIREIYNRENKVEVMADSGRVLAAVTADGFAVTHTNNTDEDKTVVLTFFKRNPNNKLVSIDRPHQVLQDDDRVLKVRFTTKFRSAAFIEIK